MASSYADYGFNVDESGQIIWPEYLTDPEERKEYFKNQMVQGTAIREQSDIEGKNKDALAEQNKWQLIAGGAGGVTGALSLGGAEWLKEGAQAAWNPAKAGTEAGASVAENLGTAYANKAATASVPSPPAIGAAPVPPAPSAPAAAAPFAPPPTPATTGGAPSALTAPSSSSGATYSIPGPSLNAPALTGGPTHTGWLGGLNPVGSAASGATPATPASVLGSTTAGAFLPAAGLVAGGLVGSQQLSGVANALQGDDMSFLEEAALALPTGGFSFAVDPVRGLFDSGKGADQQARDGVRGYLDETTNIYADRDAGDISISNGNVWNTGEATDGASYNIDWKEVQLDQNKAEAVTVASAIINSLLPGEFDDKVRGDLIGEIYNAAVQGEGNTDKNLKAIVENSGQDRDSLYTAVLNAGLDEDERDAQLAAIDKLYGVENPNPEVHEEDLRRRAEEEDEDEDS